MNRKLRNEAEKAAYTAIGAVMPEGDTLTLHIASYDCWEFPEAHSFAESGYETALHQDFGTITVEIPEADVRRLSFPEPIRFDNPASYRNGAADLKRIIDEHGGRDKVVIFIKNPRMRKELPPGQGVKADETLVRRLSERFGENNVILA